MDKASIIRLLLAIASIIKLFGYDVPEELINAVADLVAAGVLVWATWKNNSITKEAIEADKHLKELKSARKSS
ncbi:MAG: phage holin [Balneolales bacterium]